MSAPSHLANELAAFTQQRPDLINEHGAGKFALFIGGMFKGAFSDRIEALRTGYRQGGPGHFLVRKITETEEIVHLVSATTSFRQMALFISCKPTSAGIRRNAPARPNDAR